jgi:hypothetical protein
MKLYVGAWSDDCGGVFATDTSGVARPLADGRVGDVPRLAFAILVDHVKDAGRALALRAAFEHQFGRQLRGNFWTVREREVAELIALTERSDHSA